MKFNIKQIIIFLLLSSKAMFATLEEVNFERITLFTESHSTSYISVLELKNKNITLKLKLKSRYNLVNMGSPHFPKWEDYLIDFEKNIKKKSKEIVKRLKPWKGKDGQYENIVIYPATYEVVVIGINGQIRIKTNMVLVLYDTKKLKYYLLHIQDLKRKIFLSINLQGIVISRHDSQMNSIDLKRYKEVKIELYEYMEIRLIDIFTRHLKECDLKLEEELRKYNKKHMFKASDKQKMKEEFKKKFWSRSENQGLSNEAKERILNLDESENLIKNYIFGDLTFTELKLIINIDQVLGYSAERILQNGLDKNFFGDLDRARDIEEGATGGLLPREEVNFEAMATEEIRDIANILKDNVNLIDSDSE